MRFDIQCTVNLTIAKYLDQTPSFRRRHQSICYQGFRIDLGTSLKQAEIYDVNNSIFIAKSSIAITETANERQALRQASLATAKSTMDCPTATRFLAFCTTASSLASTGTMSTPHASLSLV